MEYPEAIGFDDVGPRKFNNKPSILMTRRSSPGERLTPLDQGEVDRGGVSKRGGSGRVVENTNEVGGLAVMGISPEETAKLLLPDLFVEDDLSGAKERLAPNLYEAPVAEVEHVERETESYVAWVIVLGFVAYAIALYWAHRCSRRGGDPVIRFSVLRGFGVRYTVRTYTHAH